MIGQSSCYMTSAIKHFSHENPLCKINDLAEQQGSTVRESPCIQKSGKFFKGLKRVLYLKILIF